MTEDGDQERYPYRWGDETVTIEATEEAMKEIQDVLRKSNKDEDGDSSEWGATQIAKGKPENKNTEPDGDNSSTDSATDGRSHRTEDDAQEKLTRLTVADLNTRYTGKGLYLPEFDAEELKNRIETAHSDEPDGESVQATFDVDSPKPLPDGAVWEDYNEYQDRWNKTGTVREGKAAKVVKEGDKEGRRNVEPLFSRSTITEAIQEKIERLENHMDGQRSDFGEVQPYFRHKKEALEELEEVFS